MTGLGGQASYLGRMASRQINVTMTSTKKSCWRRLSPPLDACKIDPNRSRRCLLRSTSATYQGRGSPVFISDPMAPTAKAELITLLKRYTVTSLLGHMMRCVVLTHPLSLIIWTLSPTLSQSSSMLESITLILRQRLKKK